MNRLYQNFNKILLIDSVTTTALHPAQPQMHKTSLAVSVPAQFLLSTYQQMNSLSPKNHNHFQKTFVNGKSFKNTSDLDKSFTLNKQKTVKKSQVLSKVDRKDTRQTDPEPFDYILKIQQPQVVQKFDPVQTIIKKSEVDPFLRRKLKAVVDNDLKCLKKLNDQKSKTTTNLSKTMQSIQSTKVLPKVQTSPIDDQINRLPRYISQIMNQTFSQLKPAKLKKIQSESNILAVIEHSMQFRKKLRIQENKQEQDANGSFTTLRHELYKKKINCLEVLREVKEKSG